MKIIIIIDYRGYSYLLNLLNCASHISKVARDLLFEFVDLIYEIAQKDNYLTSNSVTGLLSKK
jgi:hypothetical protein